MHCINCEKESAINAPLIPQIEVRANAVIIINNPDNILFIPILSKNLKPASNPFDVSVIALKTIITPKNLNGSDNEGYPKKSESPDEVEKRNKQIIKLNKREIRNEHITIEEMCSSFFNLKEAIYLVEVVPNPNVENAASQNIVDFIIPYSPYNSFPIILAIIIPLISNNRLPIPLPITAQSESLTNLLFNKWERH